MLNKIKRIVMTPIVFLVVLFVGYQVTKTIEYYDEHPEELAKMKEKSTLRLFAEQLLFWGVFAIIVFGVLYLVNA